MRLRTTLLSTAFFLGLSGTAMADWSGFYVGPEVNYAWSSTTWQFQQNSALANGSHDTFSAYPDGFTLGPHLGWTQQINQWVWGIQGTYDSGSISAQNVAGPVSGSHFTTKINQTATITPLLGYAQDQWLFYVKGGYASAKISISGYTENGVDLSDDQRQYGWTAGTGLAYQLTEKDSLGLEYNFTRLNSTDFNVTTTGSYTYNEAITVQPVNINTVSLVYSRYFW